MSGGRRAVAFVGAGLAVVAIGSWSVRGIHGPPGRLDAQATDVGAGWEGQEPLPPALVLVLSGFLTDRLRETSGIAVSPTHPGVLWSHNDSGGRARLFAINVAGENLGRVDVEGAGFVDWEAISSGPCPQSWEPQSCLYIGDIGDNASRRRDVTLYVIPEPGPGDPDVEVGGQFDFTYEGGPDDAEALAVDGSGNMVVVTKGRSGSVQLYELPRAELETALRSDQRVVLAHPQQLPIRPDRRARRLVTGAAFSPAGTLAVRTYLEVLMFERHEGRWRQVGGCHFWDRNPSGEAIDFLDADEMVLTGEATRQDPALIMRARCGSPD